MTVIDFLMKIFATVVISKWMGELDSGRLWRTLDGGAEEHGSEEAELG